MDDVFIIKKEELANLLPPESFKTEKGLKKYLQLAKKQEFIIEDLLRKKLKVFVGEKKVIIQTIERPIIAKGTVWAVYNSVLAKMKRLLGRRILSRFLYRFLSCLSQVLFKLSRVTISMALWCSTP